MGEGPTHRASRVGCMGVGEHLQHVLTHADDAELHAGGAGVHEGNTAVLLSGQLASTPHHVIQRSGGTLHTTRGWRPRFHYAW